MIRAEAVSLPVITFTWDGSRDDSSRICGFLREALDPSSLVGMRVHSRVGTNPMPQTLTIHLEDPSGDFERILDLRVGDTASIVVDPSRRMPIFASEREVTGETIARSEADFRGTVLAWCEDVAPKRARCEERCSRCA